MHHLLYLSYHIIPYATAYQMPIVKTKNQQAAENIGKMGISAAMKMGSIVKTKIEEEIHKHQHHEEGSGEEGEENKGGSSEDNASSDAVGGDDVNVDDDEGDDDDDEAASAEANR